MSGRYFRSQRRKDNFVIVDGLEKNIFISHKVTQEIMKELKQSFTYKN